MAQLATLTQKGEYVEISSPYNEAVVAQLREMPGLAYDKKRNLWVGPIEAMIPLVERLEAAKLVIPDWHREQREARKEPEGLPEALYTYQREGVTKILDAWERNGAYLLADSMGLGKGLKNSTKLKTYDGWRAMGDIRVGDLLVGSDGAPTRVTGVYPQPVRPFYKLAFSDGSTIEANDEHLWTMWYHRGGKYWAPLTLTTKQLAERPKLGKLDLSKTALRLPMLSAPVQQRKKDNPIPAYLMGALLANGSLHGGITLTYGAVDFDDVKQSLPDWLVEKFRYKSETVVVACVSGHTAWLDELGLRVKSAQKFIPRDYLDTCAEDRVALFHGLMDADGSCSKTQNRLTYHSTSAQLAADVQELVEGLGGIASISSYPRVYTGKRVGEPYTMYSVRIRLPEWVPPFTVSRKLSRYNPGKNAHPARFLVSVEPIDESESTCIAVDAPDRLFATEHCILTHNTAQTLAAIQEKGFAKPLILCPAVMVHKWIDECNKWIGWPAVELGVKLPKKKGGGRLLSWPDWTLAVSSYDTFRNIWKDVDAADFLGMDEGHYLASFKSLRSKAVRGYLQRCPDAQRLILTGTPMTARPRDLWNVLDILYPGRFGSAWRFQKRYCAGHDSVIEGLDKSVWVADGRSNLEELGARLRAGLMLRRVASEVLELPQFRRTVIPVPLSAKQQSKLALATAMSATPDHVGSLLSAIEEHKVKAAIEMAEDLVQNGKSPLLFTLRKETARQLGEALSCPVVTGDVDAGDRQAILASSQVGVATIYSITTGIDLTHFDCAIFVGLDWVPSTLLQAEARLVRIGQENNVTFYYLIGMGTLDEAVKSKVIERLDDFATVVGDSPDEKRAASDLRGGKTPKERLQDLFQEILARHGGNL